MDIRNWPINKVMQLPEHTFGRRFVVGLCALSAGENPAWDIAEAPLPERCVLWEVRTILDTTNNVIEHFRLGLAMRIPLSVAQMNEAEPLLASVGRQGPEPREIVHFNYTELHLNRLKIPFESGGRKPVLEVVSAGAGSGQIQVFLTFSSFPSEVAEWLVLGPGSKRS